MKNKKKAFTLVELLAVIVILAVILVIAIPQIINVIKSARLSSIKDSAMLIAEQAEKDYISQQVLNKDYSSTSIPCTDVAKLNDDYASCSISYSNGIATVKLKGSNTGKFAGITCKGTKDNMNCSEKKAIVLGQPADKDDAVDYITAQVEAGDKTLTGCDGTGKLVKVTHENGDIDYRYVGACPNNYVYFNCSNPDNPTSSTCEIWRIIGVFDIQKELNGAKERRLKLVRNDSLGNYSWDSSYEYVNKGYGINEWSQADLEMELNGDYLNSLLSVDTMWYDRSNSSHFATFDKNKVLKSSTQELIDDAVWYLGASTNGVSLSTQYANERGNTTGKICTSGTSCNDSVTRTTKWVGKIGLIYPSDYGYASANENCKNNISNRNCKDKNWILFTGLLYRTITPSADSRWSYSVFSINSVGVMQAHAASDAYTICPSLYLASDILITGEGTIENPYTFSK